MLVSARIFPANDGAGPERRRAAHLPEHVARRAAVDQGHRRAARGRQRAPDLENEDRGGVALGVERQGAGQLRRCGKTIDARRQREAAQILSRSDPACTAGGTGCCTAVVTEFWADSATASAAWIVPQTTSPGGKPVTALPGLTPRSPVTTRRTGIGHRRAAQHREALRRTERRRRLRQRRRGAAENAASPALATRRTHLRFIVTLPSVAITSPHLRRRASLYADESVPAVQY